GKGACRQAFGQERFGSLERSLHSTDFRQKSRPAAESGRLNPSVRRLTAAATPRNGLPGIVRGPTPAWASSGSTRGGERAWGRAGTRASRAGASRAAAGRAAAGSAPPGPAAGGALDLLGEEGPLGVVGHPLVSLDGRLLALAHDTVNPGSGGAAWARGGRRAASGRRRSRGRRGCPSRGCRARATAGGRRARGRAGRGSEVERLELAVL